MGIRWRKGGYFWRELSVRVQRGHCASLWAVVPGIQQAPAPEQTEATVPRDRILKWLWAILVVESQTKLLGLTKKKYGGLLPTFSSQIHFAMFQSVMAAGEKPFCRACCGRWGWRSWAAPQDFFCQCRGFIACPLEVTSFTNTPGRLHQPFGWEDGASV